MSSERIGTFVCSCADTCEIDIEGVREDLTDIEVAASSDQLCSEETLADLEELVDDRDLEDVIVSCPAASAQKKLQGLEDEGTSVHFVDQREAAGWVHDERAATEKTRRLLDARRAALTVDRKGATLTREDGRRVAVIGDAAFATQLPEAAAVTLIADGDEFADVEADLEGVDLVRGRVVSLEGSFGRYELTLEACVTDDCIDCQACVHAGPEGAVTSRPVDVAPDAADGRWVDVCPTDAIDLTGVRRTITVDQVVVPEGVSIGSTRGRSSGKPLPGVPRGGKRGYHTGTDAATVAAVTDLLEGGSEPAPLELAKDVCAAGDAGKKGCTVCHEACPHDAVVRPTEDSVVFDENACLNCGACTSSCPTGAVQLAGRPNERLAREVEALVDQEPSGGFFDRSGPAIEPQVLAFVCSERAERALERYGRLAASGRADGSYHPLLPVSVDCTDTVGEAHVLHALAAGADGVAILGCGSSCLHSGPDPKRTFVDRMNQATADLGLGERVAFLAPEPDNPEGFREPLSAFVDDLEPTPIPPGEHESDGVVAGVTDSQPDYATHDWALESVQALLEYLEPDREVIRGLETFGRMSVSDACGLTPTCSTLCPTDAIRNQGGALEFNHARCVNCGLCESGCPETAITMESGLDLSLLASDTQAGDDGWRQVYEGDLHECPRCGEAFASTATIERLKERSPGVEVPALEEHIFEYCTDCKSELPIR